MGHISKGETESGQNVLKCRQAKVLETIHKKKKMNKKKKNNNFRNNIPSSLERFISLIFYFIFLLTVWQSLFGEIEALDELSVEIPF